MSKKAVVLFSGGLDSTTVLAIAKKQGFNCYALSFSYGQRHTAELDAAQRIAKALQVEQHHIVDLDLSMFHTSALTNPELPISTDKLSEGIPNTYVPARNTIFLSLALGWAEVLNASDIFIGVNAVDYSGYPDCRPEFINAYQSMADLATQRGVEGASTSIHTPLITLSKAQIIQQGHELNVDYSQTVSCYQAKSDGRACGRCDSCRLRKAGFEEAGLADPTRYYEGD